jgi:hypothetical protein
MAGSADFDNTWFLWAYRAVSGATSWLARPPKYLAIGGHNRQTCQSGTIDLADIVRLNNVTTHPTARGPWDAAAAAAGRRLLRHSWSYIRTRTYREKMNGVVCRFRFSSFKVQGFGHFFK